MTVQEKLKFIQKISGLTQAELANKLGVTFAAFNRWINRQAMPRQMAQQKIDNLFRQYSGEKTIPSNVLEAKKTLIAQKSRQHPNVLKMILDNPDIRDQFLLSLTYNSNRIEGSTLTENETAAILFKNSALPNKSLIEQLEAKNHQAALEFLFDFLSRSVSKKIDENLILKLHGILMNSIRSDAGRYRDHAVRILGINVPTANFQKVPSLMQELIDDINKKTADTISIAALIHARFEQIHPFADGNGRIGRLLLHATLFRKNLPPAVIKQETKSLYLKYLQKAQLENDQSLLEDLICDAILEGFNILERN